MSRKKVVKLTRIYLVKLRRNCLVKLNGNGWSMQCGKRWSIQTDFPITATGFNCIPYFGKLYIVDPTSINENSANQLQLTLSPNPVEDIATLSFNLEKSAEVTIYVSDVTGKVVDRVVDKTAFGKGAQQVEISTQNYARGTYFVHLLNQDKENTVKLIK